jgi:putative oxidoreductase
MRLVAGLALITHGVMILRTAPSLESIIVEGLTTGAGLLLIVGLWTPVAATLAAIFGLWSVVSYRGDLWANILLVTLGAALALLGPGAWSVDARLFGWKRIDVRDRTE